MIPDTVTLERTQEAIASHLEDLLLRTQRGYRARTLERDAAHRAARRILDHPWGSYREHGGEVGLSYRYRAETSLLEVSWIWAQGGRVRLRARSTRVGALRPPEEGFFLNTLLSLVAEDTENPEAIARVHRLAEELGALPPPRLHYPVLQRVEPEGGEPFYLVMDPMHGEWALLPGSRPVFITESTMLGHQGQGQLFGTARLAHAPDRQLFIRLTPALIQEKAEGKTPIGLQGERQSGRHPAIPPGQT